MDADVAASAGAAAAYDSESAGTGAGAGAAVRELEAGSDAYIAAIRPPDTAASDAMGSRDDRFSAGAGVAIGGEATQRRHRLLAAKSVAVRLVRRSCPMPTVPADAVHDQALQQ